MVQCFAFKWFTWLRRSIVNFSLVQMFNTSRSMFKNGSKFKMFNVQSPHSQIPTLSHSHIPTFPHFHIFTFSNYSISTSLTNSHAFLPSPGCVTGQVPILVALMRIYRVLVFSKFRANITGPSSLMSSVSAG